MIPADRISERLGRLADHLAEAREGGVERAHTSAQLAHGQDATIALPEKLSEDDQWRVHRCASMASGPVCQHCLASDRQQWCDVSCAASPDRKLKGSRLRQ